MTQRQEDHDELDDDVLDRALDGAFEAAADAARDEAGAAPDRTDAIDRHEPRVVLRDIEMQFLREEFRAPMSKTQRVWFAVVVAILLFFAAVQTHDAVVWKSSPWLGVTLGPHGVLNYRHLEEVPEGLRPLLENGSLAAVAVRVSDKWHTLPVRDDSLTRRSEYDSLAASQRLGDLLAAVPLGSTVTLRVVSPQGANHEVPLRLQRLPGSFFLQRFVLYAGVGLLVAAFGLAVFWARPNSHEALAYAVGSVALGIEFLIGPVLGGFPPRFDWLSVATRYATPAAITALTLALGPRVWIERRPWLPALPWIAAVACLLGAALTGSVHDGNKFVAGLRLGAMVFVFSYVLASRFKARTRQEARKLELYLGGMVASIGVLAVAFAFYSPFSPYLALVLLLIPAAIGYGILKHRLFDIEVVFRRGVAYVGLAAVAVLVYGTLTLGAGALFGDSEFARSPGSTTAFVVVAILVGAALRPRLQQLVDRRINPVRFRYLEALRDASAELASLTDEREVSESLVRITTEVAGLESAAVFLNEPDGFVLAAQSGQSTQPSGTVLTMDEPLMQLASLVSSEIHRGDFDDNPRLGPVRQACLERMAELGAELLLPLTSPQHQLLGLLALGPRSDGQPINSEDLDLLKTIANQGVLVISRSRARLRSASGAGALEAQVALAPGVRIGHYRLGRPLGRGGMGLVYEALDERLRRRVALKFIIDGAGDELTTRLRREARVLANLNHPNIMQLHALEEVDGHVFLAMEYLAGKTLREELQQEGRIAPQHAIGIGIDVAGALAYAQEQQIIHRDIKLSNVMRNERGVIKLTDFGLAKLTASRASLTDAGNVVGTLAYLAPELMNGEPASVQSDMYALGVMLHMLITGEDLRRHEPREQLARLTQAVEPAILREQGIPEPLVPILARLLDIGPDDRYPDYASLIAELSGARARLRSLSRRAIPE